MRTNSMGPPHKPDTAACVGRGGAAERVNFRVRTEMNDAKLAPTMGSLFDGIGGFPLAAIHNGIVPVWASEIEAFPIEVTRLRFPDMVHVGDITKLDGAELPPVDIICGGSPCQDLSVAGNRAGLSGARSGLFMEQVRLVKEMRNAERLRNRTALYIRPRFMVWENVPGAFSSGTPKGEDFRIVLEEIVRIKVGGVSVPRPDTGRWESAGAAILGKRCSVAWRVLDAQYWGVPQRRRRIFLVADFGGLTAPKILFEPESVPGDTGKGKSKGEEAPGAASLGAEETGGDRRMTGEENRKCAMNPRSYCITGNIIGRQLQNGGNGLGCLPDVSYSLTCMDRHAVFCEKETYQKTVGTLTYSDYKGAGNQYINGDKCVVENKEQVRRLTPLECERLQGFPDGWTDIPGASDNARYRALGNSVAIPCVDFVLRRIACFLQKNRELDENGDFEGV